MLRFLVFALVSAFATAQMGSADGVDVAMAGWEQVRSIRSSNPEIEQMFQWLSHSLDNGQAEPFDDFRNAIPKMTTPVPL